jgi:uncharacterized Fe-S radical SAM superfamily protein PflX
MGIVNNPEEIINEIVDIYVTRIKYCNKNAKL